MTEMTVLHILIALVFFMAGFIASAHTTIRWCFYRVFFGRKDVLRVMR